MSYITAIGTANPPHQFDQATICSFMESMMHLDTFQRRKLKAIFQASGIDTRYSVLEDYGKQNNFTYYPTDEFTPFPSTEVRVKEYQKHALYISKNAVLTMFDNMKSFHLNTVTHLIVVSCTGMYAPGLDIELIKELRLPFTINRTCINFMGCYAAFNALKVADAFCKADASAKVLIVCTELCSLHFQRNGSDDNLLANALFADGAAAMLIEAAESTQPSLKIERFHNDLAVDGENDMAWSIGDMGFEMKLSSYVPEMIKGGIGKLIDELLTSLNIRLDDIRYFAMHPGGKKILEAIETALSLSKEKNCYAYDVLRSYGNMSSATVVFVLDKVMKHITDADHNAYVLSAAFGPGLTLESMLLRIKTQDDA